MAFIITKKGEQILVDDDMFKELNQYTWHVHPRGYARRSVWLPSGKKTFHVLMHKYIMCPTLDEEQIVDHINRIKLDNRKENLRIVTLHQNQWNRGHNKNNTSGFIGVHFAVGNTLRPWVAKIQVHDKRVILGSFATPEEASEAYQAAKARYHLF